MGHRSFSGSGRTTALVYQSRQLNQISGPPLTGGGGGGGILHNIPQKRMRDLFWNPTCDGDPTTKLAKVSPLSPWNCHLAGPASPLEPSSFSCYLNIQVTPTVPSPNLNGFSKCPPSPGPTPTLLPTECGATEQTPSQSTPGPACPPGVTGFHPGSQTDSSDIVLILFQFGKY